MSFVIDRTPLINALLKRKGDVAFYKEGKAFGIVRVNDIWMSDGKLECAMTQIPLPGIPPCTRDGRESFKIGSISDHISGHEHFLYLTYVGVNVIFNSQLIEQVTQLGLVANAGGTLLDEHSMRPALTANRLREGEERRNQFR